MPEEYPSPPEGYAQNFQQRYSPDSTKYYNLFVYLMIYVDHLIITKQVSREVSPDFFEQIYCFLERPDVNFMLELPIFHSLFENFQTEVNDFAEQEGKSIRYSKNLKKYILKSTTKRRRTDAPDVRKNHFEVREDFDLPSTSKEAPTGNPPPTVDNLIVSESATITDNTVELCNIAPITENLIVENVNNVSNAISKVDANLSNAEPIVSIVNANPGPSGMGNLEGNNKITADSPNTTTDPNKNVEIITVSDSNCPTNVGAQGNGNPPLNGTGVHPGANGDDPEANNTSSGQTPISQGDQVVVGEGNSGDPPEDPDTPGKHTVFCEIKGNWLEQIKEIKELLGKEPTAQLSGSLIKIVTSTVGTFRKLQAYLTREKIPYQCIDPRNQRPRKVLLKGIPVETPTQEIADFLIDRKFSPIKIAYLTNKKTKKPMPMFLVTLRPSPTVDDIFNITKFYYLKITVEEFKQPKFKQCYNCQGHGHSSLTCSLTPKCLKCAGPHISRDCPTRGEATFTCANCGGPHPANYGGCPKHPSNKNKNKKAPVTENLTPKPQQGNSIAAAVRQFIPAPLPTKPAWQNNGINQKTNTKEPSNSTPPPPAVNSTGSDNRAIPEIITEANNSTPPPQPYKGAWTASSVHRAPEITTPTVNKQTTITTEPQPGPSKAPDQEIIVEPPPQAENNPNPGEKNNKVKRNRSKSAKKKGGNVKRSQSSPPTTKRTTNNKKQGPNVPNQIVPPKAQGSKNPSQISNPPPADSQSNGFSGFAQIVHSIKEIAEHVNIQTMVDFFREVAEKIKESTEDIDKAMAIFMVANKYFFGTGHG